VQGPIQALQRLRDLAVNPDAPPSTSGEQ